MQRVVERSNSISFREFINCAIEELDEVVMVAKELKGEAKLLFTVKRELPHGAELILNFVANYAEYMVSLNTYSKVVVSLKNKILRVGKFYLNADSKLADYLLSEKVKQEIKNLAEEEFNKTCSFFEKILKVRRDRNEKETD